MVFIGPPHPIWLYPTKKPKKPQRRISGYPLRIEYYTQNTTEEKEKCPHPDHALHVPDYGKQGCFKCGEVWKL